MEKISYRSISDSIDRGYLGCINDGIECSLYADGNKAYKIFYEDFFKITGINAKKYMKKLIALSNIKGLDEAVLPEELIVNGKLVYENLRGFSMDYVDEAISLKDLSEDWGNTSYYFKALFNVSIGLKNIHDRPENIVLRDSNFTNVLLCKDCNGEYTIPKFIDLDSAMLGDFQGKDENDFVMYINVMSFLSERKEKIVFDANLDRLTHLIHFLNFVFGESIYELDMDEYDDMSEEINSLRNIRDVIIRLKDMDKSIPYVPYMHEFIDLSDEAVLSKK